jgi:membrane fusion protein (multidrug efflux system)
MNIRAGMNTRAGRAACCWLLALAGCGTISAAEPPSVLVSVQTPTRGSVPDTLTAYGTATPAMNGGTTLSVQSDGQVLKLLLTPGAAVNAGQPILEFEISSAARSTFEQATSALALAKQEQTRTARLLAQQLATRDQMGRADKAVSDAQAALTALEREYGGKPRRMIVAPFDGVVSAIPVAQGARVPPGVPLAILTRTGGLVVTVGIEPSQRLRLKLGQPAQLEALNGAEPARAGTVARIDHVLNPTTRLLDADIAVTEPMLQGETFRVRIETGQLQGWLVPRDAVLTDAQGAYVFQVSGGKAARVAVKLIGTNRTTAVVDGQVDPRRLLVTQGNYQLSDGMAVRLSPTTRQSALGASAKPIAGS